MAKKKETKEEIKNEYNDRSRLDNLKNLLTPYNGDPSSDISPALKNKDIQHNRNKLKIYDKEIEKEFNGKINELNLSDTQLKFIQRYPLNHYHIGKTCEDIDIHRTTYYSWLKNETFKMALDCLNEAYIDDAIGCVNRAIGNDNLDAAKFVLKTLGRRRGFVESMDITSNGEKIEVPVINIIMPKIDE